MTVGGSVSLTILRPGIGESVLHIFGREPILEFFTSSDQRQRVDGLIKIDTSLSTSMKLIGLQCNHSYFTLLLCSVLA